LFEKVISLVQECLSEIKGMYDAETKSTGVWGIGSNKLPTDTPTDSIYRSINNDAPTVPLSLDETNMFSNADGSTHPSNPSLYRNASSDLSSIDPSMLPDATTLIPQRLDGDDNSHLAQENSSVNTFPSDFRLDDFITKFG
jgi:hypothetical protein